MDYLERVQKIAEKAEHTKRKMRREAVIRQNNEAKLISEAFDALEKKLRQFQEAVRERVPVFIQCARASEGKLTSILVSISSASPYIRRPFFKFRVSPKVSDDITYYVFRRLIPTTEERHGEFIEIPINGSLSSIEQLLQVLEQAAASFLANRNSFLIKPPEWYAVIGCILGWPLSIAIWAVTCFLGGWLGAFLGWIPATIAFHVTRYLWGPFLLLVLIYKN